MGFWVEALGASRVLGLSIGLERSKFRDYIGFRALGMHDTRGVPAKLCASHPGVGGGGAVPGPITCCSCRFCSCGPSQAPAMSVPQPRPHWYPSGCPGHGPACVPACLGVGFVCGVCFVYIFPSFRFLFVMFCLSFFVFYLLCFLFRFIFVYVFVHLDHPFAHRHHPQQFRAHTFSQTSAFTPKAVVCLVEVVCATRRSYPTTHGMCILQTHGILTTLG